ncbi:hypothetical protein CANINC_001402 [Pichia inconspicua]|uniref:Uncharacterized protein n=1 Tax=Pichia inconspicua TaxID=52247 RepID=A0A4T0X475_9ASCO|nr:hypothetical protein CANINC_001402 [[Candida] inconspicua]
MYVPIDITRANTKPTNFQHQLVSNIYPIQTTDPNAIFNIDDKEFGFSSLDFDYIAQIGIRISRTPLSPSDPSTYAALSKFTEYFLRRVHASSGILGSNQLDRPPLSVPKDYISSQLEGKTEVVRIGSMLNPLASDNFQPVHLIPGCISDIVNFSRISPTESSNIFNSMFGKARAAKSSLELHSQPTHNLNKSNLSFVEKVSTCDGYQKKMNTANSLLIACHGRILNVIALNDNPKEIDIDPPCLRVILSSSVVTCMSTFQLVSEERSLDILLGFASGDILWLNPFKMKCSFWNRNGRIKNEIVTALEWSNCGNFAFVGFADGDMIVWDRRQEEQEGENEFIKDPQMIKNHMSVFKSAKNNNLKEFNPVAYYKFTKRPITCIRRHPTFANIIILAADDEFLRSFDLLNEQLIDIVPTYYGGTLTAEFSSDGRYLLAGGEDDMVSIYEFNTINSSLLHSSNKLLKLVARLQGAKSWIKSIEIIQSNPKILNYTVGTAGDDGFIRFYEFQPRSLRKVKKHVNHDGVISYLGSPKYVSNGALSASSIEPSVDSRKKRLNFSSNTLSSLNVRTNRLSLNDMKNQQNNFNSPSLKSSFRLGDGISFSASKSNIENKQRDLLSANTFFCKNSTKHNILFLETFEVPFIHDCPGINSVTKLLPVSEKNINLGRLSGIYLGAKYIWAFSSGGDLLRWKVSRN